MTGRQGFRLTDDFHPASLLDEGKWEEYLGLHAKPLIQHSAAILTSLSPCDAAGQSCAALSWQSLALPVVSLNVSSETSSIAQKYPWIRFETPSGSAEKTVGKPLVLFDAFLRWFSINQQYSHIVLINADIALPSSRFFWYTVFQLATDAMVIANRIDTDVGAAGVSNTFFPGFDFFVIPREMISVWPESSFCLGAPWWDYWAPFVPLAKGKQCKLLLNAQITHKWHPPVWSHTNFVYFCKEMIRGTDNLRRFSYISNYTDCWKGDVNGGFEIARRYLQFIYSLVTPVSVD